MARCPAFLLVLGSVLTAAPLVGPAAAGAGGTPSPAGAGGTPTPSSADSAPSPASAGGSGVDLTAGLASHRALYAMSLASAQTGSSLAELQGEQVVELRRTCEGWRLRHRLAVNVADMTGGVTVTRSAGDSVESLDGRSYRFEMAQASFPEALAKEPVPEGQPDPRQPQPRFVGQAVLEGTNPVATYTVPQGVRFTLKPETLFPVGLLAAQIRAAAAGQRSLSAVHFDGAEGSGPGRMQTVFLPAPADSLPPAADPALYGNRAFRMRIAFFPDLSASETPSYEASLLVTETGVLLSGEIQEEAFASSLELTGLQPVEPEPCP